MVLQRRWKREKPAAIKIRWDGDRTSQDADIPGDIAKAKAVRKLVGDDFRSPSTPTTHYSVGGAIRVGRALEELGFVWFEEPVQHYDVRGMGEVARRLDITVSAAEQTYTLQGLEDMINAGVRMVQPDIVKMGGITGLMQCAAIATRTASNWCRTRRSRRWDIWLTSMWCPPSCTPASLSNWPTTGSAPIRSSTTRRVRSTDDSNSLHFPGWDSNSTRRK